MQAFQGILFHTGESDFEQVQRVEDERGDDAATDARHEVLVLDRADRREEAGKTGRGFRRRTRRSRRGGGGTHLEALWSSTLTNGDFLNVCVEFARGAWGNCRRGAAIRRLSVLVHGAVGRESVRQIETVVAGKRRRSRVSVCGGAEESGSHLGGRAWGTQRRGGSLLWALLGQS